ncbi:MAG: HDOD domain-containing protein [Spartobacteria bacterium]|nr:HDOD domain-containing protein [Spartobacteria bacterium]
MDRAEQIFKKLDQIRDLPTLPAVITKLGSAIRDPNVDAARIAKIIEDDPAMMARILKVVNSVLYKAAEPINSLQMAVARMGLTAVHNIAMSTSVFSTFGKREGVAFSPEEFWQHSISTGIATGVLYERTKEALGRRLGTDVLHLSGLLHDIGKIILAQYYHEEFMLAIETAKEKEITLLEAESEVIGIDHAEIGAWLGLKWNLSSEFLQTVRWHHDPESADIEHQGLVMLCHTANYICNLEKIGYSGDAAAPSYHQKVWIKLGLTVKDISQIVDDVLEESKESEIWMSFI